MEKYVFALWPETPMRAAQRREVLIDECAAAILAHSVNSLTIAVDDEFSTVKSPAPKWYKGDPLVALVSVGFDDTGAWQSVHQCLMDAGFRVGVYRADQSIYKDYGDNSHFNKRDWPDGDRSPSVLAVTLLTRPKKLDHAEWIRRWHGGMSPVSERLQPRAKYVRNVVMGLLTDDTPEYDGIVEEAWPSAEHITNQYLFYCASNPFQLVSHMAQMIRVITRFHQMRKIRTVTMSEYLMR